MNHLNKPIVIGLVVVALSLQAGSLAQAAPNPSANAKVSRIVGVWDVTVSVYHCVSGALITTFPALHKFELGGTGQLVPAGDTTFASAHMAVWEHLGNDNYSTAAKFFRYDNGQLIGSAVIISEVWTDKSGMVYGGSGVAELYDLNGDFITLAGCPTFEGTRFTDGS